MCSDLRLAVIEDCQDTTGFEDAYGNCKAYSDNKWCASASGLEGVRWDSESWGPLNATVMAACCACGKQPGDPLLRIASHPLLLAAACLRCTRACRRAHALVCVPVL